MKHGVQIAGKVWVGKKISRGITFEEAELRIMIRTEPRLERYSAYEEKLCQVRLDGDSIQQASPEKQRSM